MCQHLYVATPQGNSSEKCVSLWQRLASPSILAGLRGWLLGTTCFPMAQDAYLCQRSGRKGKSIFMGRKHTHKQIMSHRSPVERTTEEKSTFCVGLTSFLLERQAKYGSVIRKYRKLQKNVLWKFVELYKYVYRNRFFNATIFKPKFHYALCATTKFSLKWASKQLINKISFL